MSTTALIIVESCFGGTRALAEQVALGLREGGIRAGLVPAGEAPHRVDGDTGLLILAAPTHNRGLPTPASRRRAMSRGGGAVDSGIREWLEEAGIPPGTRVMAVDTVTGRGWVNGSAAKQISKALARRRPPVHAPTRSFLVDSRGPVAGQEQEARAWGRSIASAVSPS